MFVQNSEMALYPCESMISQNMGIADCIHRSFTVKKRFRQVEEQMRRTEGVKCFEEQESTDCATIYRQAHQVVPPFHA